MGYYTSYYGEVTAKFKDNSSNVKKPSESFLREAEELGLDVNSMVEKDSSILTTEIRNVIDEDETLEYMGIPVVAVSSDEVVLDFSDSQAVKDYRFYDTLNNFLRSVNEKDIVIHGSIYSSGENAPDFKKYELSGDTVKVYTGKVVFEDGTEFID